MIYTIGHSKHPIERFVELLEKHGITALADVRSTPFSRFNPQFNRERLKASLAERAIQYVFLGEELGARSKDPEVYEGGRVSYAKLAETNLFKQGIERLKAGMKEHRIALMCAEKDPLDCHRTILVSRRLVAEGVEVSHILDSGELATQVEVLMRLRRKLKLPDSDIFQDEGQLFTEAYELQGQRIAYQASANK
jgi:uncharacterized protein (DUF488 family)